jgi:hypothetical protein
MDSISSAVAGAVATAVLGVIGFLINRLILVPRSRRRDAEMQRVRALHELKSLLAVSLDTFQNQNFKARMLLSSIEQRHPDIVTYGPSGRSLGFDEVFFSSYDVLSRDEMELFQLIRGTTLTTMHDTNSKMLKWIEDNPEFVIVAQPNKPRRKLREKLEELRTHLNQWFDKYAIWIPNNEKRSLVYLADEKDHGIAFPNDMEGSIDEALYTLNQRVLR